MIEIERYSSELIEREGIYYAKNNREISYPESGNQACFQLEENSFWFNHRNNCIAEAVMKYSPDRVFFDVGGGNGYVAKALENRGVTTVLVEPGAQGCFNARTRNLQNIICSTLEDAAFKEDTVTAVGLFDVVEHIEDDIAFLTAIYNLLKEDGLVYITVPAFNALWSGDDVTAGHFRRYSKNQMAGKLKSVGFEIEYSSYIFSVLVVAVMLFRALPDKLGLKKNSTNPNRHKNEHAPKKGLLDKVLNRIWKWERNRIKNGKTIPFGGSCFVIARKPSTA
jgi:SAM-dependent methyltransferase